MQMLHSFVVQRKANLLIVLLVSSPQNLFFNLIPIWSLSSLNDH